MALTQKNFGDGSYQARYHFLSQVGGGNQFALNTTVGTAGQGGVLVNPQSQIYVVSGTDATAQTSFNLDYQIVPGSPLTI